MRRKRPSDLEQLISDYYKDHATITRMKYKWVDPSRTPRKDVMPFKPKVNQDEMGTSDSPVDQSQGDKHKNKKSSNSLLDPSIVLPKKKAGGKPPMSPVRQVMKAVTDLALNPKRKKATKKGSGDKIKSDGEASKKDPNAIYKNSGN